MLVAADAADPMLDCHHLLQRLKNHPEIRKIIGEGKVVKYGAKTVTIGGWASVPKLYTDGAMICGDSASFLNPMRIKGIHLSMKTGMLAAEAAFDAMLELPATRIFAPAFRATSCSSPLPGAWPSSAVEPT